MRLALGLNHRIEFYFFNYLFFKKMHVDVRGISILFAFYKILWYPDPTRVTEKATPDVC